MYKLTVRELREGVTAKQIVIKDSFDTDGAVILIGYAYCKNER